MVEAGQRLAHYRLSEKLGQGGMGVVWKATDTKLDREVAIKFLPEQFAADAERLGRFEREARLLASLNHRNIAAIYGHEEVEGLRFLVMELVEGEDLAQRLHRGPLPLDEALDVCHQLARALDNAHERGILHRDLKPANVRISHDGRVKVLDFGLAKAFDTTPMPEGTPTMSPTLTSVETRAGIILGTAAYMSPEQARGKPVDKRTDIWSFGCLLYECLSGTSPFHGDTLTDTLAAIVKTPADYDRLPANTPPGVRQLIQRCLEKDVRNRLRDIGEARIELQRLIGASDSMSDSNLGVRAPVAEAPRRAPWPWLAAAALVGAVVGAGLWAALVPGPTPWAGGDDVVRFSIVFPDDLGVTDWNMSPDGRTIAYVGSPKNRNAGDADPVDRLFVRPLDALEARPVENSEGVQEYAFSADGNWLLVRARIAPLSTKYRVWKVPVDGGSPPLALFDWRDEWSGMLPLPGGDIAVLTAGRKSLVRIPASGGGPGEPIELRNEGFEGGFRLLQSPQAVLADGVHALGSVTTYTERGYDDNVGLLNLETGEVRILIENGSSAVLASTGHLVFARGDALLATEFDAQRLRPVGNAFAIQAGFRAVAGYGDTSFALSRNGTKLNWPGGVFGDKRRLVYVEPSGDGDFRIGEPWSDELRFFDGTIAVSRDRRRLAVVIANDAGLYEIWISDMDRPRLSRFVHEAGQDCLPDLWTPDGAALIYNCGTTDKRVIYIRRVDSAEAATTLLTAELPDFYRPTAFLGDGSAVVATHFGSGTPELVLLPLEPDASAPTTGHPWLRDASIAQISRDGRWLAYLSDASGRMEVYVRPIREDGSLGREIPVTTTGGGTLSWIDVAPGNTLSYHKTDGVFSVDIDPSGRVSTPKLLGSTAEIDRQIVRHEHLSDGRWLAIRKDQGEELPDRINVVLNWTTELRRRMSAN